MMNNVRLDEAWEMSFVGMCGHDPHTLILTCRKFFGLGQGHVPSGSPEELGAFRGFEC